MTDDINNSDFFLSLNLASCMQEYFNPPLFDLVFQLYCDDLQLGAIQLRCPRTSPPRHRQDTIKPPHVQTNKRFIYLVIYVRYLSTIPMITTFSGF